MRRSIYESISDCRKILGTNICGGQCEVMYSSHRSLVLVVQTNGTENSGRFVKSAKRRQPSKVVLFVRKNSVGVNRSICFPNGTTGFFPTNGKRPTTLFFACAILTLIGQTFPPKIACAIRRSKFKPLKRQKGLCTNTN